MPAAPACRLPRRGPPGEASRSRETTPRCPLRGVVRQSTRASLSPGFHIWWVVPAGMSTVPPACNVRSAPSIFVSSDPLSTSKYSSWRGWKCGGGGEPPAPYTPSTSSASGVLERTVTDSPGVSFRVSPIGGETTSARAWSGSWPPGLRVWQSPASCPRSNSAASSSALGRSRPSTASTSTSARHLPRPARPQRRRQVDDDAAADRPGDRRLGRHRACSATSCPREAKAARAEMGVVPQLDNLDVDVTVEDNLAVFARLYRVQGRRRRPSTRALDLARLAGPPPRRRRRALRRHAPAAAARPRAGPRAAADPARRAHRRPRPPDPHRALVADRRAAHARARRS